MAKKKLLTEKEILAMPKKDYMNERQVDFFRNRLQMMEAQLRSNPIRQQRICVRQALFPIRPIAQHSKRNAHSNCVRATVKESS